MLKKDEINAAVNAELLRQAEMSGISETYVLERTRAIVADADARDTDKLRAYELLGKHLKLWNR